MKKWLRNGIMLAIAAVFVSGVFSSAAAEPVVERMTKETLKKILDEEKKVHILDVRAGRDWSASEFKIKGAVRTDPGALDTWVSRFPKSETLVLYCA